MKIKETKIVNVEKPVVVSVKCDICDEVIKEGKYYYDVNTSHSDWGADSSDSFEQFHICSDKCLNKKFEEYIGNDSRTKKIDIEMDIMNYKNV